MDSSEVISIEIDIGESIKDIDDISRAMKEIENTSLELSKSIKSAFASLNQNLGAVQVFFAKIPPRACGLVGMTRRVRSRIKLGKGNSMKLKGRRFQLRRSVLWRRGYILIKTEGSEYGRSKNILGAVAYLCVLIYDCNLEESSV